MADLQNGGFIAYWKKVMFVQDESQLPVDHLVVLCLDHLSILFLVYICGNYNIVIIL